MARALPWACTQPRVQLPCRSLVHKSRHPTKGPLAASPARPQFVFRVGAADCVEEVRLDSAGPRLLVSALTTQDTPVLRWKLKLLGNNACELGLIPSDNMVSPHDPRAGSLRVVRVTVATAVQLVVRAAAPR
jgi:hypothetical protein